MGEQKKLSDIGGFRSWLRKKIEHLSLTFNEYCLISMQRGVEPVFWWPKNLKCTKCYCSISALYCFRQYNADHSYSDQWHHLHWYFYLWCHWSEPPCLYKKQSTRAMTSCWTQLSSSSSSFFLFFFFFLSTFTLTIFSTLWYNSKSYWQVIYIYIYIWVLGPGWRIYFFHKQLGKRFTMFTDANFGENL